MNPEPNRKPFSEGWERACESFNFTSHGYFPVRGPKSFVIDGVLGMSEFSVTYGDPEAGKGNFALSMALAAATAMTWFGRPSGVLREDGVWWPAGVLYFALERSAQVERRINAFATHWGITRDLPIAVSDDIFDLRAPETGRMLSQTVWDAYRSFTSVQGEQGELTDYRPECNLVIIDTLARALGDGSDSDPGDLGAAIRTIDEVQRTTGAHVMLIHHSPTNGDERMRGHGSLNGAIDSSFYVKSRKNGRVAVTKKNSDGPAKPVFHFSLLSVPVKQWDDDIGDFVDMSDAPILVEDTEPKAGSVERVKSAAAKSKQPAASKSEEPVLAALASIATPASEDAWRAAYDGMKEEGISASNHRTRFSRGKTSLAGKGLICQDGELWNVTVSALQIENCNSDETVT